MCTAPKINKDFSETYVTLLTLPPQWTLKKIFLKGFSTAKVYKPINILMDTSIVIFQEDSIVCNISKALWTRNTYIKA